jgi:hypothetical protein
MNTDKPTSGMSNASGDFITHKMCGVKLPTDVPDSIEEGAYTSPIRYTPKA